MVWRIVRAWKKAQRLALSTFLICESVLASSPTTWARANARARAAISKATRLLPDDISVASTAASDIPL